MFERANALKEDLTEKQVRKIVMELYRYTREHFTEEEKMMQVSGYPKRKEHIRLHNELITRLNAVSNQPFDNNEAIWVFKKFVYDWLTEHILYHDKDYFRFRENLKI
jgi:hemerythrin